MDTAPKKSIFNADIPIGRVSLTQKALFAKHLAVTLHSGLTVVEALNIAADSAQGKLARAIRGIQKTVEAGRPLSSALADYPRIFSGLFVQATYAGETSGTLPENLENIATELEKEKELVSKIKGAMVYPVIVLIATFFLAMGVAFFVLPKIIPLFEGLHVKLPPTTQALIAVSHFIDAWGWQLFWGIIAGVIVFSFLVRRSFAKPITHWLFLHTPILKDLVRGANLARFCHTLGTLLKSGLNIDEALAITRDSLGNYYYRSALTVVSARIRKGSKLSDGLDDYKSLFPLIVTRMVKVGEESGKFEETLFYLAQFYETEVDAATKTLSTAIEPVLLLFIGVLVGGLALSIITPIYEITGNLHK